MRKRSFSIIIPTYGREKEVFELLDSISLLSYDSSLIEVVIVDQNKKIDLAKHLPVYEGRINIKHIRVDIKGIAHAKNVGLRVATGEIITFADDDSTYYSDTISKANECFNKEPKTDIFYGRVFDRVRNKNIIREWKSLPVKINKFNYHLNYIAIACFTSIKDVLFDEGFGVGTQYGIGEELDYLLQTLDKNYNVWYTPEIEVWHPELNVFSMTKEKVTYYAKGYGAICKKHGGGIMLWNFAVSCAYQFAMMIILFLTFKWDAAQRRYLALAGRWRGYIEYGREK